MLARYTGSGEVGNESESFFLACGLAAAFTGFLTGVAEALGSGSFATVDFT